MLDPAVLSYIDSYRPRHLAQLKEFLRFPSISAQPDHHDDCLACANWLMERLQALGLRAECDLTLTKPLVLAESPQQAGRATLLIYGHYDVQPPEPLDLWSSPPFEPTERDGDLIARGASDDKGPLLSWLNAAEAMRAVAGDFPVNLKFLIEGSEEIGSPKVGVFVANNVDRLRCDCIAISDSSFFADGVPSITYGLRGLLYVELTLTGPNRDVHSGQYGGAIVNPLNALAGLIAGLHDEDGRVTLPGFYDDVLPPSDRENQAWRALGREDQERRILADLGVADLAGESGYSTLERLWARPALDCNGLWGGYMGEGPKTVIPSFAKAKLSARLVCNQDAGKTLAGLRAYFQTNCPRGARVELTAHSTVNPWLMPIDSPALALAVSAMEEAFGRSCVLVRGGASVPVTRMFHDHLGVDPLMMGYALPDDRVHSPNEKFRIDHFHRGIVAGAALMSNLAQQR
ncbi:MAG: dipeptidase [Planctomycetes bacterium]|nr:dipeptidase [Planctomycetota bacterium]